MPQSLDEKKEFLEYLARLASHYYIEGKTQRELAKDQGISRQKVQRLLRQARELGIVEINIRNLPEISLDLENRLKSHFELRDIVVVTSHAGEAERRHSVARAAANYLERHLADGMVVTVGMGGNTGEVPDFFNPSRKIECTFVPAMGNSPHVGESINPNDICQKLAEKAKARSMLLYAPTYVSDNKVRDILFAQEAVEPILIQAKQAHIAMIGIGTPSDDATLVRMDCLSPAQARRLALNGAVGDILGQYFDQEGHLIKFEMYERLIGLTIKDLRKIPTVIAVASEKGKSKAILGALRTGAIHVLITDSDNAQEVLRMYNAL